jgi:DNA-binding Lrp family transcriptional regulator
VLGNRLEQEILEVFDRDFSQLFSINQISKKLHKSYPHINAKVNNLIREGVLSKANVGRSYLCSLNLENEKSIALLMLESSERKQKAVARIKNSAKFFEEIARIKSEFKVNTILLSEDNLIFVLDYIHDREAIKNMFSEIKQFELKFYDKESFSGYLLDYPHFMQSMVVLYSYEKYFEIVSSVKEKMISKALFSKAKKTKDGK